MKRRDKKIRRTVIAIQKLIVMLDRMLLDDKTESIEHSFHSFETMAIKDLGKNIKASFEVFKGKVLG